MTQVNRWMLSCRSRVANIWYNQDYTVYGLNPASGSQSPADGNVVALQDRGDGTVALQCGGGYSAFASMRDDYGYQVQFQAPGGGWIKEVRANEIFQAIPTGDGYFALYSPTFGRYVMINPAGNPKAGNCNALTGATSDVRYAARFTATGLDHNSVFDFLRVGQNASGLSFAGVDLASVSLSGNLSLCDFSRASNLGRCTMNGANLQQAQFAGAHVGGLRLSGADCTGADFSGCDFTGFVPGTPPPVLAQADLTGAVLTDAVVPGPLAGVNLSGAVLAGANLTGADLSGPATNLAGAHFSGRTVSSFAPVYKGGGIGGCDLANPADRVIAYDYESSGKLDHLVCYRPGTRQVWIIQKKPDGTFTQVYSSSQGIGGYDLSHSADRIIAYDYAGTGHLDHLVCYRPGTGAIFILQKASDASSPDGFKPVYNQGDPGAGIGGYNLTDPADQIIAYDYAGTGHPDHLVCYRPGKGAVFILQKVNDANNPDAFKPVYSQGDPGHGIGPYDLADPADRIIAYDYAGTGHPDHLVCYRPGTGAIFILQKASDTNSQDAFTAVYSQGGGGDGIGGYILADPADRIIAYDYAGTGHLDHLVCYRPGAGLARILSKAGDQNRPDAFTPVYQGRGIGGYDLAVPADQIIVYQSAGKPDDLICYRPGGGVIWIIEPEQKAVGPATLTRCKLGRANLSRVDLTGFDLTTVTLAGANLSSAVLSGATVTGIDLTGATLAGTDFTGLDLTTVRFSAPMNPTDPKHPTIFARCTLPYSKIGLNWSCLDLTNTTITGLPDNLTGLNATGARRAQGNFSNFVLDRANFAGATLDGAVFTGAKLRDEASFAGASLLQAFFTGADLDQASFAGATLGGVQRSQAANFSSAYLSNCDFTQASMYGVIFAGATLIGANKLTGATDLGETDFSGAYLANADFTGASLQGAKFDGAFMAECVLTGADLTPAQQGAVSASLAAACLQAAHFQDTKLAGANLAKAAITNARGQIQFRYYGEDGKLTDWETMHYPARSFPAAASFSSQTVCPNLETYGTNTAQGLTIAQMMTAPNPPTQWQPEASLRR